MTRHGSFLSVMLGLLLTLFAGCKPTVPSRYIQPDDLEDILYDYQLAETVAEQMNGNVSRNVLALQASVLKEHGVTQAEFDSSMVYYTRHADRLHDIYEHIATRMQKEASQLGASEAETSMGMASLNGDTLDIWRGQRSMVLIPMVPYNLCSFEMPTDSSFHKGDGISLLFHSNFIFQDGMRDGMVILAVTLGNDSVTSRSMHISSSSTYTLSIDDNDSLGIKAVRGFFILNKSQSDQNSSTTLRVMSVSNIRLFRKRQTHKPMPATPASGSPQSPGRPVTDDSATRPTPPPRASVSVPVK
jgi:hypothetical protein